MTKKHNMHHVVANELHFAQSQHHNVMSELLLNPKARDLHHVTEDLKVEHNRHANLLKEIVDKHELHHEAKNDILGVHHSAGVVVENIVERSQEMQNEVNVRRRMNQERNQAMSKEQDNNEDNQEGQKREGGRNQLMFTNNNNNTTALSFLGDRLEQEKEKVEVISIQLENEQEKVRVAEAKTEIITKENILLKNDKERQEKHIEEIHVELTASTEETNRLRTERLELLETHQKESIGTFEKKCFFQVLRNLFYHCVIYT